LDIIIYLLSMVFSLIIIIFLFSHDLNLVRDNALGVCIMCTIAFIPEVNMVFVLMSLLIIVLLIIYKSVEKIIGLFVNKMDKKEMLELSEIEKFKIFKQGMINEGQFKDEVGIEDFITGMQVAEKLMSSKGAH